MGWPVIVLNKGDKISEHSEMTYLGEAGKDKFGKRLIKALCNREINGEKCETEISVLLKSVRRGHTKSCGCLGHPNKLPQTQAFQEMLAQGFKVDDDQIYTNSHTKVKGIYPCGHKGEIRHDNCVNGQGCPKCAGCGLTQPHLDIFLNVVRPLDPQAVAELTFDDTNFRLDIYSPLSNKGIEYDGPRHDQKHKIYTSGQAERDKRRNKEWKNKGMEVMVVNYKDYEADRLKVHKDVRRFLSNKSAYVLDPKYQKEIDDFVAKNRPFQETPEDLMSYGTHDLKTVKKHAAECPSRNGFYNTYKNEYQWLRRHGLIDELFKDKPSKISPKPIKDQNGIEYASQQEAARELGLGSGNISQQLKGKRKSVGGYVFSYLTPNEKT